jgi:beta-phosphoglucomutase-like phosphatase (HAD superfamily)
VKEIKISMYVYLVGEQNKDDNCFEGAYALFKIVCKSSYDGVRELISNDLRGCLKAVVSGAAKQEVDAIIERNFGKDSFDLIMNGDELGGKGKPEPAPFKIALQKLNLDNDEVLVVENAPLGIKSANDAGIQSIVTLNTSPLALEDFKDLISEDRIFKDTKSAGRFLKKWCISGNES